MKSVTKNENWIYDVEQKYPLNMQISYWFRWQIEFFCPPLRKKLNFQSEMWLDRVNFTSKICFRFLNIFFVKYQRWGKGFAFWIPNAEKLSVFFSFIHLQMIFHRDQLNRSAIRSHFHVWFLKDFSATVSSHCNWICGKMNPKIPLE